MPVKKYTTDQDEIFQQPVTLIAEDEFNSENVRQIMQDLMDTHFQDEKRVGVGLAANQIGYPVSIFLIFVSKVRAQREGCKPLSLTFWINARYEPADKNEQKVFGKEGCFSVPGFFHPDVPRYSKIHLFGQKITVTLSEKREIQRYKISKDVQEIYSGFQARLFQHECDHMSQVNPIFFYDYLEKGKFSLSKMTREHDPRTKS